MNLEPGGLEYVMTWQDCKPTRILRPFGDWRVEGAVTSSGERARVTAYLKDPAGSILWTRKSGEMFGPADPYLILPFEICFPAASTVSLGPKLLDIVAPNGAVTNISITVSPNGMGVWCS